MTDDAEVEAVARALLSTTAPFVEIADDGLPIIGEVTRDAARAAIAALDAVRGWRPIETAPDDGIVLVSDGKTVTTVLSDARWWRFIRQEGTLLRWTHWMPLPPAPEDAPRTVTPLEDEVLRQARRASATLVAKGRTAPEDKP